MDNQKTVMDAITQTKAGSEKFDKIIEVRNLVKVYGTETVVDNISLSIKRGDFVTLLGPSGCGKTTLLRMIAGFEQPTSGIVLVDKKDVTSEPPYKRPINTVFQKYALFPHLNVFGNIAFGLKLKKVESDKTKVVKTKIEGIPVNQEMPIMRKLTKEEIAEKVSNALKLVGLEGYEKRDVNSLSGGQQQRVAIARAIVLEPQVLLLDEPLGALDLKMRKEMQAELMAMHKNLGITFIYVTHDQEEALTMSDKVVVLNDGIIQQIGTPKKVYDEPKNAFVANFIGESNILTGTMIKDYKVSFCGVTFDCEDKGFEKNEKVDLVVRPEDIAIHKTGDKKGVLEGTVTSNIFKGVHYEINVETDGYEFTAQNTIGATVGEKVSISVPPNGIHIMKRLRTINEFITTVTSDTTIELCGGDFKFINDLGLSKGDRVRLQIPFDKISLTDNEEDGIIGGNVSQSLYKGEYYQVQVYTDTDEDFYLDTTDEWDIDDRIGIMIKPEDIKVSLYEPQPDESEGKGE